MNILRYASDLHLEYRPDINHSKLLSYWDFDRDLEKNYYLALVGDIGNPYQENLLNFLTKCSAKYNLIFFVPGNHEYYNLGSDLLDKKSFLEFKEKLVSICQSLPNVILLDNNSFEEIGIKFIGSTLWSHISDTHRENLTKTMSEYKAVYKNLSDSSNEDNLITITVDDTNDWNEIAIRYITTEIESSDKPCIILTHHAPLFSNPITNQYTADPSFLNGQNNEAFHNDLGYLIKKPLIAWIYGHTHYTSKFVLNDVIVATNQLGYNHEEEVIKFDSDAKLIL